MKQLQLDLKDNPKKEHGGQIASGQRKTRRPLNTKGPIHLVLKSDFAQGPRSLLKHTKLIERILKKAAQKFRIRIYEKAIVTNHIHLLIRGKRREDLQNFFRVTAGHIAQEILRAFPIPTQITKENKFWRARIYSRLLTWGREFKIVKAYLLQNMKEALGLIPYQPRRRKPNTSFGPRHDQ